MTTLAKRLAQAMANRRVNQSEIARELKITQGTISLILVGKTQRSRHLPEIADYLGVSHDWLIGRASDDGDDARDEREPAPTREEMLFLSRLRAIGAADRQAAIRVAGGFIDSRLGAEVMPELPAEAILAQMFEGILAGINPDADRAEQALLLAQSLPTALAQSREFLNPTKVHRPAPRRGAPAAPTLPVEDPQRQST